MRRKLMGVILAFAVVFMAGGIEADAWQWVDTITISGNQAKTTKTGDGFKYHNKISCTGGNIFGGSYDAEIDYLIAHSGGWYSKGESATREFTDYDVYCGEGAYSKLDSESWIFKFRDKGKLVFEVE
jgi:hypothetical protein